jgi:nucleotide-binding universal stress UspA family protein
MTGDVFQRILIADDGCPDGQRAAEVGVKLAAKLQAEVILVGVVEIPKMQMAGEGLPVDYPRTARRKMEERFAELSELARSLNIWITIEILEGWAEKEIRKRAEAAEVDLIVVGRSNSHKLRRWLVGSTSGAVMRKSACSVMVVR